VVFADWLKQTLVLLRHGSIVAFTVIKMLSSMLFIEKSIVRKYCMHNVVKYKLNTFVRIRLQILPTKMSSCHKVTQKLRVNFFNAIRKRNRPEEIARYFEKERTCKNTLCCNLKLSKRRSSTFIATRGCISYVTRLARAKSAYFYFSAESAEIQVKINRHSFSPRENHDRKGEKAGSYRARPGRV